MKDVTVEVVTDASGAAEAAHRGHLVVIVDIIDFSTTMEAALGKGALEIWGASPKGSKAPVPLSPEKIGFLTGNRAQQLDVPVVVVSEPRAGNVQHREERAQPALLGLKQTNAAVKGLVPNLGAETVKMVNFQNTIVLGISDTGGTAFDAAFTAGGSVCTATIARVGGLTGLEVATRSLKRVSYLAQKKKISGVTMVAASGKSLEDVLAAEYLADLYNKMNKLVPSQHKN